MSPEDWAEAIAGASDVGQMIRLWRDGKRHEVADAVAAMPPDEVAGLLFVAIAVLADPRCEVLWEAYG